MGLAALFQGLATASSVGMGCGSTCGSGMGIFMSGYLATHSRNIRQSALGFSMFYTGKIMAVVILCILTSIAGKCVMSENGEIFDVNVVRIVDIVMIVTSLVLIYKWTRKNSKKAEKCKSTCSHCHHCASGEELLKKSQGKNISYPVMLVTGICYGVSPCAPLILILGYSVTLPWLYAGIVGLVFSIASALSPTIIVILLAGSLASRFRKEIEGFAKWFQLACYIALMIISLLHLVH